MAIAFAYAARHDHQTERIAPYCSCVCCEDSADNDKAAAAGTGSLAVKCTGRTKLMSHVHGMPSVSIGGSGSMQEDLSHGHASARVGLGS